MDETSNVTSVSLRNDSPRQQETALPYEPLPALTGAGLTLRFVRRIRCTARTWTEERVEGLPCAENWQK